MPRRWCLRTDVGFAKAQRVLLDEVSVVSQLKRAIVDVCLDAARAQERMGEPTYHYYEY